MGGQNNKLRNILTQMTKDNYTRNFHVSGLYALFLTNMWDPQVSWKEGAPGIGDTFPKYTPTHPPQIFL